MLLSVCMIVKNEQACLARALTSVEGIADEVVVVDTGSTDETVRIAKDHGARVLHHVWSDDFSAARNVGVQAARGRFILYIDADEELVAADRIPLRRALESAAHDVLLLKVVSPIGRSDKTNTVRYPRVFRRYPDARFVHRLHEQVWPSIAHHQPKVLTSEFVIMHHGYAVSDEAYRSKCERNLDLAERIVADEPNNAFYLFHVGLGHLTLGRSRQAIDWLERARAAGQDDGACLNALGQAHQDLGEEPQAVRCFSDSVARTPEQHHGWAALGDLHLRAQRYDDAERAFGRCLAVRSTELISDLSQPESVLWMKRGMAQLMLKRGSEAEQSLSRALRDGGLDDEKRQVAERYHALAVRFASGQG